MDAGELERFVAEIAALSAAEAFRAYLDLVAESPDHAQVAALALRNKARAGGLDDEHVPLLEACLRAAPDQDSVLHLAKALAAFGRAAHTAAPALIERIDGLHVISDVDFWILDGALFALGYMGGDDALRFVDALAQEKPSRALRSRSVYEGTIDDATREKQLAATLESVRALLTSDDPGVWREKKRVRAERREPDGPVSTAAPAKKKPWMLR